jgi:glycosyltransferase involved in cell wall biosynthesis
VILIDADVLGRNRTGEETYVLNLLRALPLVAPDLELAAVTRHPGLVPDGVQAIALAARSQELRMAWTLPRLLRRLRPQLAHFQHALPLGWRGPSIVTLHDLHFEHDPDVMGLLDRWTFKVVVPRAARRARHVLAVSERTRSDAIGLYGLPADKVTVTHHGVDASFAPGPGAHDYVLFVGAIQARKDPLTALEAANHVGLPLVVAGPEKEQALAGELRRRGADVRGWIPQAELAELYRGAAALVLPSRYEGFGIPVLEAMASGTPAVVSSDAALREVGGEAVAYSTAASIGDTLAEVLANRDRYVRAGIERARLFTWEQTARLTAEVYRHVLV